MCFNLAWFEQLLIWLVVIGVIVALVRLLLPIALGPLGPLGATISQALYIVVWGIVAIAIIVLIFDLIACFIGIPRLR